MNSISSRPSSNKPLVSVVVPMRNEASNVEDCLRSLAGLTCAPIEIIIVNDRSTDDTRERIESWLLAEGDTRLSLFDAPAEPPAGWVGKAFATDAAIGRSCGKYVLIADADVRHSPASLEESLELLGSRDMLVRVPYVPLRNAGSVLADFLLLVIAAASQFALRIGGSPLSFGAYVLMRRSFYDSVGGFSSHRSFPESLPLARLAAKKSAFVMANPARAVTAELYPSLLAAMRGTLRNINFGLVAGAALCAAFVVIGWPLFMLSFLPGYGALAALSLWSACVLFYERSCGRSWLGALFAACMAPVCAALLAAISCLAMLRLLFGIPIEWRGRRMRVQ